MGPAISCFTYIRISGLTLSVVVIVSPFCSNVLPSITVLGLSCGLDLGPLFPAHSWPTWTILHKRHLVHGGTGCLLTPFCHSQAPCVYYRMMWMERSSIPCPCSLKLLHFAFMGIAPKITVGLYMASSRAEWTCRNMETNLSNWGNDKRILLAGILVRGDIITRPRK